MAYTAPTDQEVRTVTGLPASTPVAQFIAIGQSIVDQRLIGKGYTDEYIKTIHIYLAAHFATLSSNNGQGRLLSLKVGESEERYVSTVASNLQLWGLGLTPFGQQALALAWQGELADMATSPLKAQFKVY